MVTMTCAKLCLNLMTTIELCYYLNYKFPGLWDSDYNHYLIKSRLQASDWSQNLL